MRSTSARLSPGAEVVQTALTKHYKVFFFRLAMTARWTTFDISDLDPDSENVGGGRVGRPDRLQFRFGEAVRIAVNEADDGWSQAEVTPGPNAGVARSRGPEVGSSLRPACRTVLGAVKDLDRDHIDEGCAARSRTASTSTKRYGRETSRRTDGITCLATSLPRRDCPGAPPRHDGRDPGRHPETEGGSGQASETFVDGAAIHVPGCGSPQARISSRTSNAVRRSLDQNGIT
jgi:hypothetical protein